MSTKMPLPRPGLAIAALAASGMLTSLQFTLVIPALPTLSTSLGISANDTAWLLTITLITGAVGTPVLSRMADMYGKRRLLLISLFVLALGSAIAAIGMTFTTVLIGRGMQGFASAIIPIGISLLREQLPAGRAGSAVALMSATLGIGSTIGLLLSGLLVQTFGVTGLFWFSATAGTVFGAGIIVAVRESTATSGGRFDLVGALLLAVGLSGLLLAVSKGIEWGWTSLPVIGLLAVGTIALSVWVPLQLRHPSPVINLRTSFRRTILQTNIATFLVSTGMFANHLLTVHEVQAPVGNGAGLGLDPLQAGLTMIPATVMIVALSPVAGLLLDRFGGRLVLTLGATTMAMAFLFRLLAPAGLTTVVLAAAFIGMGTALCFASTPTLIMAFAPASETAAANGINALLRSLAGAVASAVFALMLTSAYAVAGGGTQFLNETGLTIAIAGVFVCCVLGALTAAFLPRGRSGAADAAAHG